MHAVYQLAAAAAAIVAVLAAFFAAVRWGARVIFRAVDEWRGVQLAMKRSSEETARLARVMREQVGTLIVREAEDRRQLRELSAWRAQHDREHRQRGNRPWAT